MFLSAAGCLLMVYILCISGVEGKPNSVFALKGSSVNLSCSAPHSAANIKWYIVSKSGAENVYHDVSAHKNHERFIISEDNFTLTIRDLPECERNLYCCSETVPKMRPDETDSCQQNSIQLRVIDLQVKVFPASERQKVTLMCSSSCSLTESPAAFIWYQNGEFLYEDWSPWYQELVNSDQAVRYSCAIKGYEDLRAPDVSVDSVSGSCFSVTYAGGRMCSYKSEKQSCSITFPADLLVDVRPAAEVTEGQRVTLTCSTSCPLSENTNYIWYLNSRPLSLTKTPNKHLIIDAVSSRDEGNYSCAVEMISSVGKTLTVLRGRTATTTVNWGPAARFSVSLLVCLLLSVFVFL
ncbi:PREDICTED: sialoadhesin-like isoform X3 [Poecilia mexicana]|uniref:sialoadhesin-like isoform X3 n=1 Tax=Poecilia mexicana TaxID=48701 RepID=UPI00072DDFC4|nr:PREDICTED: sialoadhesin-like isoform X3 [Poecilia mexicana]